jgi:hypothetical protein
VSVYVLISGLFNERRIEATFKRGQDSYRVVEPMMMVYLTTLSVTLASNDSLINE